MPRVSMETPGEDRRTLTERTLKRCRNATSSVGGRRDVGEFSFLI